MFLSRTLFSTYISEYVQRPIHHMHIPLLLISMKKPSARWHVQKRDDGPLCKKQKWICFYLQSGSQFTGKLVGHSGVSLICCPLLGEFENEERRPNTTSQGFSAIQRHPTSFEVGGERRKSGIKSPSLVERLETRVFVTHQGPPCMAR